MAAQGPGMHREPRAASAAGPRRRSGRSARCAREGDRRRGAAAVVRPDAMRSALVVLAIAAGCTRDGMVFEPQPDAADSWPYPPPRSGVVPPIGGPDTLEIATWNIENFPASAATPSA